MFFDVRISCFFTYQRFRDLRRIRDFAMYCLNLKSLDKQIIYSQTQFNFKELSNNKIIPGKMSSKIPFLVVNRIDIR